MSDFVFACFWLAFGVWGVVFALLLKLGKVKPGSLLALGFHTPLGGLIFFTGFLVFGLSEVFEYPFPTPKQIVIPMMLVAYFVGSWIEWKARKARKARSEAND